MIKVSFSRGCVEDLGPLHPPPIGFGLDAHILTNMINQIGQTNMINQIGQVGVTNVWCEL